MLGRLLKPQRKTIIIHTLGLFSEISPNFYSILASYGKLATRLCLTRPVNQHGNDDVPWCGLLWPRTGYVTLPLGCSAVAGWSALVDMIDCSNFVLTVRDSRPVATWRGNELHVFSTLPKAHSEGNIHIRRSHQVRGNEKMTVERWQMFARLSEFDSCPDGRANTFPVHLSTVMFLNFIRPYKKNHF